jgi:hypothetical protein
MERDEMNEISADPANENDDNDHDEDDDEMEQEQDEKGNLKYKFTATYRMDEATGSFQEQSKTIFENKSGVVKPQRPPLPPQPRPTTVPIPNSLNNVRFFLLSHTLSVL